tara:strand:- start:81 stop:497 length:417 start_codon:yes stop_codon:yes gene_type:complete
MKKITKYRYRIEEGDKKAANLRNWNNSEYTVIGNLAEIAACKYLGLEWTTASRAVADIIDDDGMRYQVKSCKEAFEKKRFWLEQTLDPGFDRYIFCVIDEEEKFVNVEADMIASIAHKNAHEFNASNNGQRLKAIYRK